MFDATTGAQTAAFREHTLPVHCLAADSDDKNAAVHSTGKDSRIASFLPAEKGQKMAISGEKSVIWRRSGLFRPQPRNVMALRADASGGRLFLGGANCNLTAVLLERKGRGSGDGAEMGKRRRGGAEWERHWEHLDETFGAKFCIFYCLGLIIDQKYGY